MQYQFSQSFIDQIVQLALQIARHQRGEDKLQDIKKLEEKYFGELKELEKTSYPHEEIPDVLYYACCMAVQGDRSAIEREQRWLPYYRLTQQQVEDITLAKYRLRAAGPNSKDFAAEREAIREALR
jgi:hypothetical protein